MTTKARIGDSEVITGKIETWSQSGDLLGASDFSIPLGPTLEETISYEDGPRGIEKNCSHIKISREFSKGSYYRVYTNSGARSVTTVPLCPGMGDETTWSYTPPGFDSSFVARAFNSMKPVFKADFSLGNFIYELRELGKMVPLAKGIITRLNNTKAVSEAHLNLEFAIKPLIGDLERLYTSIVLYELNYSRFVKASNKALTSHYKENKEVTTVRLNPYSNYHVSGETMRITHKLLACEYTATMGYTYTIVGGPPPMDTKLLLKYLGLRGGNTANIIWNALPFSFVVDWVFKVGNWLEQFDSSAIDINIVVTKFTVSTKTRSTSTYEQTGGETGEIKLRHSSKRIVHRSYYQRQKIVNLIGNPQVVETLPVLDKFSGREQALTVSLLNVLRK